MATSAPITLIGTPGSSAWNREAIGRFASALVTKTSGVDIRAGIVNALGDPLKVVSTGARNITINAGVAELATPSSQGSLVVYQPTPVALTSDPADGVNARWDLVIVEIDDLGTSDSFGNFRIVKGIPSSSPQVPSTNWLNPADPVARPLHNGGWFSLAACLVPASGSSGSITTINDLRPITVAAGGMLPVKDWAAATGLPVGTPIFEQATGRPGVIGAGGAQLFHPGVMRFYGQQGASIAGTSPTWPFTKTELLVQTNNAVVELNAQGDGTLIFPAPFPNGVLHVSLRNGDLNARVGCSIELFPNTTTLSQCGFRVYMQSTGTAPAGPFRVHSFLLGW